MKITRTDFNFLFLTFIFIVPGNSFIASPISTQILNFSLRQSVLAFHCARHLYSIEETPTEEMAKHSKSRMKKLIVETKNASIYRII